MLNKIIRFSLNNRMVILVASVLLILAGTYTAANMEIDVFPDLNAPTPSRTATRRANAQK